MGISGISNSEFSRNILVRAVKTAASLGTAIGISFSVSIVARRYVFTHDPKAYPNADDNAPNNISTLLVGGVASLLVMGFKIYKSKTTKSIKIVCIALSIFGTIFGAYWGMSMGHELDFYRARVKNNGNF